MNGGINTYGYAYQNPLKYTDPLGLAVYACNRGVNGFPFVGNHSYLYNDKNGMSCGMTGSSGLGMDSGDHEEGPDKDSCNLVKGSEGKEDEIMDFCGQNALNGMWFPLANDCHNAVADAIESAGLNNPGAPGGRLGPRENPRPRANCKQTRRGLRCN